jgi:hypothetical protein
VFQIPFQWRHLISNPSFESKVSAPVNKLMRAICVLLSPLIWLLVGSTAAAANQGTEPNLKVFRLPASIKSITILEVGIKAQAAKDLPDDCSSFKMSKAEVRSFFQNTNAITRQDFHHMINWSPCFIRGGFVLKNGLKGDWYIQQYRSGSASVAGKNYFLYCPKRCKAGAFM